MDDLQCCKYLMFNQNCNDHFICKQYSFNGFASLRNIIVIARFAVKSNGKNLRQNSNNAASVSYTTGMMLLINLVCKIEQIWFQVGIESLNIC